MSQFTDEIGEGNAYELAYHEFYIHDDAVTGKKLENYKVHVLELGTRDNFACNRSSVGYSCIGPAVKAGTNLCMKCLKARPELQAMVQ